MANQETIRHNMMLVCRRDGFLPTGQAIGAESKTFRRPAHIVLLSTFPDSPGNVNVERWSTCCGVMFEPGTAEVVDWADEMPHPVCVKKAGLPQSVAQRVHDEAKESHVAQHLQSGN